MEEPISLSDEESSLEEIPQRLEENSTPIGAEVLVMTVEIGDGRQDTITVRESDDPTALAAKFAQKHGLDSGLQASLEQLIRQNRELVDKRATSVSPDLASWKDWLMPYTPATGSSKGPYTFHDNYDAKATHTPHINSVSRRLMDKRSRMGSVHNRLYQLGKKPKQQSSVSSSATSLKHSRSQSQSAFNYGEWMYIRGKKLKETQQRNIEEKKKEEAEKQAKILTFAPSINRYSALLCPRFDVKVEDQLAQKGQEKKSHIERMRTELTKKELKECSFKPQLNQQSVQIELSKGLEKPRYADLYEGHKKREAKLKAMEEEKEREFNFTPNVVLTCSKNVAENQSEIVERLMNSKKKFEEKMSRLRHELEMKESVDTVSGQRLFTPSTGRLSSGRNSVGVSVFEHLYSLKDHRKEVVERISEQHQKELFESSIKLNENSNAIYDNFRRKQLVKLFKQLDTDGDGGITSGDLADAYLDYDVVRILSPIFLELQASNSQLKFEEFAVKVDQLFGSLTVQDRAVLMKRENKIEPEEIVFKPTLGQMTEAYAAKRRANQPADLYERSQEEKKTIEKRLKLEAKQQAKDAMKGCTFKPATTPYLSRKQRQALEREEGLIK